MIEDLPPALRDFFNQNPQFEDISFLKYLFKIFQIEVENKRYFPYWRDKDNIELKIVYTGKPIYVSLHKPDYYYRSPNPSDVILKNYKFKETTQKQLQEYEAFYKRNPHFKYYLYKKGQLNQFLDQFKLKKYVFSHNPYLELINPTCLGKNWLLNYFRSGYHRRIFEYQRIYNTNLMKGYAGWKVDIRWEQKGNRNIDNQEFKMIVPKVNVTFIKSSNKARFIDWIGIDASYRDSSMILGEVLNPSQQVPFMNWIIENPWGVKG